MEQVEKEVGIETAQKAIEAATAEKYLTAEEIFKADDFKYEDVFVPEWGGKVLLRTLSAAQAIAFNQILSQPGGQDSAHVYLVAMSCVSPIDRKSQLFSTEQVENQMKQKSIWVYRRLSEQAAQLNGFNEAKKDKDKKDAAAQAEGTVKNG